eukprot:Hpha_TRINITY_DN14971_c2_g1::TRINITY_DN14971_c2_g1_i1::g.143901::m.143901/K11838/USP7, UBP15; ubiquitin carboxyl-terminal hydrolase 7
MFKRPEAARLRVAPLDEDGSACLVDFHLPVDDWLTGNGGNFKSHRFKVGASFWNLTCVGKQAVGVYLESETARQRTRAPEGSTEEERWECTAHFRFQVLQKGREVGELEHVSKDTHRFTPKSADWGFQQLVSCERLKDKESGLVLGAGEVGPYKDGYEKSIHLRVTVKDLSDPPEEATDQQPVGLRNQGATCYLNSVLQMLFHLSCFREATYQLPVQWAQREQRIASGEGESPLGEDFKRTLPFALAKLFWSLQTQRAPVSTTCLTESFGWARAEALEQHDVQELLRKLMDNLEAKMKDTMLRGFIDRVFLGRMRSFIKCIDFPFESERVETFNDIQVTVRGNRNLQAALASQLEQEELSGDNKYHACDEQADHGMRDAKKGVEWLNFPPVMVLHLQRFDYDHVQDQAVKVNDRFEFPETLDMAPYLRTQSGTSSAAQPPPGVRSLLEPDADAKEERGEGTDGEPFTPPSDEGPSLPYRLHSVLVHSGTVLGGHYYAFVRADGDQWFKFDDNRVCRATQTQAVLENYGGVQPDRPWLMSGAEFSTSAYMLVYVDRRYWTQACCPPGVAGSNIPRELADIFQREAEEERQRKQQCEEAHKFLDIALCGATQLHTFDDTCPLHPDLKPRNWVATEPLRVPRDMPWADFVVEVGNRLAAEGVVGRVGEEVRVLPWL